MRCLYLTNNAVLAGFTLTNGYAWAGGGVYCESTNAVLTNCMVIGNGRYRYGFGGGAFGGTLNNCTLTGNSAAWGGGASSCTLNHCMLTGNSASADYDSGILGFGGGGAFGGTLNNCTLTGNNSSLIGNNSAGLGYGGGAADCTLNNCTLTANSAGYFGGGATDCTLNNCTLTGNSAAYWGGGAFSCTLNNCIVYFNTATNGANYYQDQFGGVLNYCCTTPMPTNGVGNISNDLVFVNAAAGNYHLSSGSPCINAGNNAYVVGSTDLDGRPRIIGGTVDMGAYEYRALLVWQGSPSPVPPYATWATAATNIQDAVDASLVGDDIVVTNGVYAPVTVNTPLTLQSVNGPGVTVINGGGAVRCLYLTNSAVMVGFTLTNGVIGGGKGGGVFCESTSAMLTNCVLTGNSAPGGFGFGGGAYGGTLNNCTFTGNSAGWDGGGAYSCTLNNCTLTGNSATVGGGAADATLNNCTLSGNSVSPSRDPFGGFGGGYGGGASGSTLNNCTLTGNSATGSFDSDFGLPIGGSGGGADYCTLNNCTLTGNSAGDEYGDGPGYGGGACGSTLNNCTLTGNSAPNGGGSIYCTLNNCIVYFNTATNGANYYQDQYGGVLNYCCTTPLPTNGVGNITNAPLFVDYAGGNLRLQSNSPCINAGNNAYVVGSTDLDGNPAHRRRHGGHRRLRISKHRLPSFPTPGSSNTACPPTAQRIPSIWTAPE